ncbi:MAG: virulence protein [Oscillospiraceae bacterium]|nr:virulence protein [Oscillospiraceae bacterium]
MKINYNVQGKERKALVNIIAETIGEEAVYEKAPTYNYTIGDFTVERDGTLSFNSATIDEKRVREVINALEEGGFKYEDSDSLSIGVPLEGFTPETLNNLRLMVESKAVLIKKALGVDSLPIEVGESELTFPWFRSGLSREETHSYAQFITELCRTAKSKKRVTAKPQEVFENEKFAMRVWLISLGMKGETFKATRHHMLKNLEGDSGWRYGNENGGLSPRRERVYREVVSVRFTPEVLGQLAELASQCNMSRNQLIESVVCEYIQSETLMESELEDESES